MKNIDKYSKAVIATFILFLICLGYDAFAAQKTAVDTLPQYFVTNKIEKKFIYFPVKTGNPKTWIKIVSNDSVIQEIEVELADTDTIDFYGRYDVSSFLGEEIKVIVENASSHSKWKEKLMFSDQLFVEDEVYKESLRPQVHFSPMRGWLNDPNGLFYHKGIYHMFYQHVPFGVNWDNTTMSWGHAISTDLLHWKERKVAIQPDKNGVAFSGSAVVDWYNTSKLQTNPQLDKTGKLKNPPLVILYTTVGGRYNANYGQSLAYSLDEGNTWEIYSGNPVLSYQNTGGGDRDPKVFWYGKDDTSGKWVMPLYIKDNSFAIFSSKDLIHWEKMSEIEDLGCNECPDLLEFSVDNNPRIKKWVFWGGAGCYMIGDFDGVNFKPESKSLTVNYGGADYAGQTFSNIPDKDGRVLQMAWLRGSYPNMPFSQAMTVPRELKLITTTLGSRLTVTPAKEVKNLRNKALYKKPKQWKSKEQAIVIDLPKNDAVDIELEIDLKELQDFNEPLQHKILFSFKGQELLYDLENSVLSIGDLHAPLQQKEKLSLRIILDRTSLEIFANGGEVALAHSFVLGSTTDSTLKIDGNLKSFISMLNVFKMKSIWN